MKSGKSEWLGFGEICRKQLMIKDLKEVALNCHFFEEAVAQLLCKLRSYA